MGALTVLVVLGMAILLRSERFHAYLLRTAQQKATEALSSQARMRDFAFHWSGISPTIDLYGVVVQGATPYSDSPLLQADAIHVRVTVTSLLHKAWYVSDVGIEHPVVRILADRDGRTNLPPPKQEKPGARAKIDVFDLGIRHLLLERGEIYYNNRKSELSADVHDLMLQSGFEPLTKSYSGTLSYRDGHLQIQNSNSIGHNFHARFVAAPEEFKLEGAELNAGRSRLSVVATVRNYSQPQVHATYQATLDATEFRRALKSGSLPTGILQSSGVLDYDSRSNRPLLATVAAHGEMRSTSMTVTSENAQVELRNIGAHYSLANGNAEIEGIHVQLLGGALAGTITMRDLAGSTKSRLSASLRAVSLAELQSGLQRTKSSASAVGQIALRGLLNATADATWGKTMEDMLASADATLQGSAQPAKGGIATPINGVIHTRYIGKRRQLAFEQSYVRTPGTSVVLNGTISDNAALQIRATSNDVHELETIVASLRAPGAQPIGVYGRAALNATVSGSTRSPQISGQLTAENLRVRGSEWRLLRANVAASPSQIRVEDGELDSASRGRVTFKLVTALQQWSPTKSTPFQLQIAASQINAADLMKASGSTTSVVALFQLTSWPVARSWGPWVTARSSWPRHVSRASQFVRWTCSSTGRVIRSTRIWRLICPLDPRLPLFYTSPQPSHTSRNCTRLASSWTNWRR